MRKILTWIFLLPLCLFVIVSGSKAAQSEWWGAAPAELTVNDERMWFSDLLGVQQLGERICAIRYQSFMGHETAHLFRGIKREGRTELVKIRRIRGEMIEGPTMELYSGVTGIAQRIYVGGNEEPRVFFLTAASVSAQMPQSIELSAECAE
ncbi:hypothetical protein J2X19_000736 [Rhodoferax ferrireducens]|uniref:Uncharacterized protein n=1 Tax=Rhodoferax ferrireducens TaxID=192843 RepID=A0ABU2C427_9BURK|nr:hypothetical protein [Rhodoferax ferrireducens]MDR7376078.1 hypothetical protein [Rhodoferax ferrireducens]